MGVTVKFFFCDVLEKINFVADVIQIGMNCFSGRGHLLKVGKNKKEKYEKKEKGWGWGNGSRAQSSKAKM